MQVVMLAEGIIRDSGRQFGSRVARQHAVSKLASALGRMTEDEQAALNEATLQQQDACGVVIDQMCAGLSDLGKIVTAEDGVLPSALFGTSCVTAEDGVLPSALFGAGSDSDGFSTPKSPADIAEDVPAEIGPGSPLGATPHLGGDGRQRRTDPLPGPANGMSDIDLTCGAAPAAQGAQPPCRDSFLSSINSVAASSAALDAADAEGISKYSCGEGDGNKLITSAVIGSAEQGFDRVPKSAEGNTPSSAVTHEVPKSAEDAPVTSAVIRLVPKSAEDAPVTSAVTHEVPKSAEDASVTSALAEIDDAARRAKNDPPEFADIAGIKIQVWDNGDHQKKPRWVAKIACMHMRDTFSDHRTVHHIGFADPRRFREKVRYGVANGKVGAAFGEEVIEFTADMHTRALVGLLTAFARPAHVARKPGESTNERRSYDGFFAVMQLDQTKMRPAKLTLYMGGIDKPIVIDRFDEAPDRTKYGAQRKSNACDWTAHHDPFGAMAQFRREEAVVNAAIREKRFGAGARGEFNPVAALCEQVVEQIMPVFQEALAEVREAIALLRRDVDALTR